jgi:hypothetical protein
MNTFFAYLQAIMVSAILAIGIVDDAPAVYPAAVFGFMLFLDCLVDRITDAIKDNK